MPVLENSFPGARAPAAREPRCDSPPRSRSIGLGLSTHHDMNPVATESPSLPIPPSNQASSIPTGRVDCPPKSAMRIHHEDGDVLLLVRLCVANQADFVFQKKTDFWISLGDGNFFNTTRALLVNSKSHIGTAMGVQGYPAVPILFELTSITCFCKTFVLRNCPARMAVKIIPPKRTVLGHFFFFFKSYGVVLFGTTLRVQLTKAWRTENPNGRNNWNPPTVLGHCKTSLLPYPYS